MTTVIGLRPWVHEERFFAALKMSCGLGSRPTRRIGVWGTQLGMTPRTGRT
jgi:hypothetical protein